MRQINADAATLAVALDTLAAELRGNRAFLERQAEAIERQQGALSVTDAVIFGPRDGSFVELQPQPRMRSVTIYNPTGIVVYVAMASAPGDRVAQSPDLVVPPMAYASVPYAGQALTLATDPILTTVQQSQVLVLRSERDPSGPVAGSLGVAPMVEIAPYSAAELAAMQTLAAATNGAPSQPITLSRYFRRIVLKAVATGTGSMRLETFSPLAGLWVSSGATATPANSLTPVGQGTNSGGLIPFSQVRFRYDNTDAAAWTGASVQGWIGTVLD